MAILLSLAMIIFKTAFAFLTLTQGCHSLKLSTTLKLPHVSHRKPNPTFISNRSRARPVASA